MSKAIPIGMCASLDNAGQVAPGYDYLELPVASSLDGLQDDATFGPKLARLGALRPPIAGFNVFLPGSLKVVGPDVRWDEVETYVERAIRRAAALGGQFIVFGSGGARSVPEGYSRALAWGQLVHFLNLCADQAERRGVTIVIEPLNHTESNILNSYPEGVQLARDVNRRAVKVLADIYHFEMDGEPLEHIREGAEWLAHVHLADTGRRWPGSGSYPLEKLFHILKEIGYEGRASVECKWGEDLTDESARALMFLRTLAG